MKQRTKEAERHIEAVLRAMDVLDCFLDHPCLSTKQIIDKTGLTRSRVMRLVGTLEYRGYLIQDSVSRSYLLSNRAAGLGKSFERANNTDVLIRPVLKYLVEQTGESATFYVADGVERVALAREEGTHAIRLSIFEGQRTPIHAGASGKVLLAWGDPDRLQTVITNKLLRPITRQTITNPGKLKNEINKVRAQGYAISKGENIPDSHAIAAPVFNYENRLVGAIGIAGPANRLVESQITGRIQLVIEASQMLSKRYGTIATDAKRLQR
jgi:IclR family transcriptional regulator, KDG regulon repressor